ncbi:GNAT family N-acetyltransferase [Streptomyces sp. BYX5S]
MYGNDDAWVRPRRDPDLTACAEALRAVHHADGYPVTWPEDAPGWIRGVDPLGAWVAVLDGRVVGHVLLARPDGGDVAPGLVPAGSAVGVVARLFVAPAARGHGLGAALLDRAVASAAEHGMRAVLDVVDTDAAAIALYERLGWTFLARAQQVWGNGRLVTVRCYAAPDASDAPPGDGGAPGPRRRPRPLPRRTA